MHNIILFISMMHGQANTQAVCMHNIILFISMTHGQANTQAVCMHNIILFISTMHGQGNTQAVCMHNIILFISTMHGQANTQAVCMHNIILFIPMMHGQANTQAVCMPSLRKAMIQKQKHIVLNIVKILRTVIKEAKKQHYSRLIAKSNKIKTTWTIVKIKKEARKVHSGEHLNVSCESVV